MRIWTHVLEEVNALGVVPIAYYPNGGFAIRIRKILSMQNEGAKGTMYKCVDQRQREVLLLRAYETGYWFIVE